MIRKCLLVWLIAGMLSISSSNLVFADNMQVFWDTPVQNTSVEKVRIKINGEEKSTKDIEPVINNGTVFVPVSFVQRFFAETTAFDEYDGIVYFDGDKIIVDANTGEITRYGLVMANAFPPYVRQSTIMIPLRTIALAFNFDVAWDGGTNTVLLTRHSANDVDRNFISHY